MRMSAPKFSHFVVRTLGSTIRDMNSAMKAAMKSELRDEGMQ